MKIVDYMKKNKYSILWMAITMIWAVCFVLIAHDGFSGIILEEDFQKVEIILYLKKIIKILT